MGASGLGSLLVKEGFLTEQDRLTITKTCGQGSWAFAKSILAIGLLDEDELAAFFAERTRYQIAPRNFLNNLDESAVHALDKRLVSKLEVIPLKKAPGKITVGVVDPLDRSTLKQLEFFTGLEVEPVVIPLSQLYEGLLRIDPDFRLQSTALTHFLQNHAQSAWVRQRLDTDTGEDTPVALPVPLAARPSSPDIEEMHDDPEIEVVEDDEIPAVEADGFIDPFGGVSQNEDDAAIEDDLGEEIFERSATQSDDILEMIDEEGDENGDKRSASRASPIRERLAATIASFDSDLDLLMAGQESSEAVKIEEMAEDDAKLAIDGSTAIAFDTDAEFNREWPADGEQMNPSDPFDSEAALNAEGPALEATGAASDPFDIDETLNTEESKEDERLGALKHFDSGIRAASGAAAAGELKAAFDPLDALSEGGDNHLAAEIDDAKAEEAITDGFDSFADENEETKVPVTSGPGFGKSDGANIAGFEVRHENDDMGFDRDDDTFEQPPLSSFGFEETIARAMPALKNIATLATLNDHRPSLAGSDQGDESIDHGLFAELHAASEADDHFPMPSKGLKALGSDTPKPASPGAGDAIPKVAGSQVPPVKPNTEARSFDDNEDTHIDLRHSHGLASDFDDDDIQLHPRAPGTREFKDSGLNPTSALNETMLKISLSFSSDGVLTILRDSLYKIGDAGCLVNTKSQKQIIWSQGILLKGVLNPSALLAMLKSGMPNRWETVDLKASESWSKKPMKLRLFRTGNWLWAHYLKAADDTMIFRETVESMASQLVNKLGAG